MLKLDIVSNDSNDLHTALGLDEDRCDELILLVRKAIRKEFKRSQAMKYFADKCQSLAEYSFAYNAFCDILARESISELLNGLGNVVIGIIHNKMSSQEGDGTEGGKEDYVNELIRKSMEINGKPGKKKE